VLENLKLGPEYEGFLFLAESVRNPPALRPHHHEELELNLVGEGEISYVVGDRRYTFPKRTLLWLFPEQVHQLVDRTANAKYYVAVFKPEFIRRACRGKRYRELLQSRPTQGGVAHTELPAEDFDHLRRAMDGILADGIDSDILNREAGFGLSDSFSFRHNDPDWLNAGLRHLLLLSWRYQQGRARGKEKAELHPAVKKALHWLNEMDGKEGSLELHRYCGVSKPHLSRVFHHQVGVPLSRYRNSIRLSRFWEAFRREENQTLLEAVYEAGFGSYAQFFRVYKEAYGQGPRKSLKG